MRILTITVNPALDKSTRVQKLAPEKKLRCEEPTYEPGGGGINVSRAIKKLGGESCAWYLSGGAAGERIGQLLQAEGVSYRKFECANWTRESLMVLETATGDQYRFGMPGPHIAEHEWRQLIDALEALEKTPEFVVASGSISPGVPDDFYAQLAAIAVRKGFKLVVDTSGEALIKSAGEGIFLLKPNLNELAALAGKEYINAQEQEALARKVIGEGKSQALVVSLGPRGAMLATKDGFQYVTPPTVKQESAVGAGDSMVGGMVLKLTQGWAWPEVIRYGVATGTATTMTPGSELCRLQDVEEIYGWIKDRS
ncbi:1-phosphofructokinase family hexose kinase [Rufibacter glacialis]|uniref:1-phosphofructokinase family hexose kinase n=1 Tax=Rufibacter glacialis TaxID=1259555 RepID=A0A5M8Q827_9BACT|nr:1-phosphofructokinase family hexose kinase [Rufibacter glacialis]KAA6430980.1 1-phosphofructokinase family hexose kinase [Rufibacter glacialis]GGK83033.1 phosphofructokinase [Rufibacter glacialis]